MEAYLLSSSTLNSLVSLLPTSEYDLWIREMTVSGILSELKLLIVSRRSELLKEIQTRVQDLILVLTPAPTPGLVIPERHYGEEWHH